MARSLTDSSTPLAPDEIEREITIVNRRGIHGQTCGGIIEIADRYDCEMRLVFRGRQARVGTVNGRPHMTALISMGVRGGDRIVLRAKGPDAERALDEMATFFATRISDTPFPPGSERDRLYKLRGHG